MPFKKYCSIDEKSRKLTLENFVARGYTKEDWGVLTKIHGANFSIIISKDKLGFAKRTSLIDEDDNFYNFRHAVVKHHEKFWEVRRLTLLEFGLDEDHEIQFYGELFGGHYPHPDVPNVVGFKKVQDKVWYCPYVDFYPFDIYVRKGEVNFPLDQDVFERIVSEAGFTLYAKTLFVGSFEDCLNYPNDYLDPTYKHYGLPPIEDNICEGNVLKPIKACCMPNGSRVILKTKNAKFTERKREPKERKPPVEFSDEAKAVVVLADEYINENRLRNVLSHVGEVTDGDFGKIMGLFSKDVRKDMEGDDPEVFSKLEKAEGKIVNKAINTTVSSFIRKHFVNIIDGVF